MQVPKQKRHKLGTKGEKGVLIGCYENSTYKVWIQERQKALISRHVHILENEFYPLTSLPISKPYSYDEDHGQANIDFFSHRKQFNHKDNSRNLHEQTEIAHESNDRVDIDPGVAHG